MTPDLTRPLRDPNSMSCLREVQTISKSPHILPMPSLTRLTTGGVLNPLKNTTNTSHNELLHQDPLQPPLEPRGFRGFPKSSLTRIGWWFARYLLLDGTKCH